MLTLRADPAQRGGGHALLEGPGLDGLTTLAVENCYSGLFLGLDGKWSKARAQLPVAAAPPGALALGPHIVDFVPTDAQMAFHGADGTALGAVFWADIHPSRNPGAVTALDILGRRKVVIEDAPPSNTPEPATVPRTPPAPEPRLEAVPQPPPRTEPTPDPAPIPQPAPKPIETLDEADGGITAERQSPRRWPLPLAVWGRCARLAGRYPSLVFLSLVAPAVCTLVIMTFLKYSQNKASFNLFLFVIFVPTVIVKIIQIKVAALAAKHDAVDRSETASILKTGLRPALWATMTVVAVLWATTAGVALLSVQGGIPIGLALLLVPGIAVLGLFAATVPGLIEGRSLNAAIQQSIDLTRGYRFASGITMLVPITAISLSMPVMLFIASRFIRSEEFLVVVAIVIIALVPPVTGLLAAILWNELRRRKTSSAFSRSADTVHGNTVRVATS